MDYSFITNLAAGIGAGVVYSLTSYGKKKGQLFEVKKFLKTVITGAVIGILYSGFNVPLENGELVLSQLGLVAVIDNFVTYVIRKFKKEI